MITLSDPPSNADNYKSWNDSLKQVLEGLHNGSIKPTDLNESLFTGYKDTMLAGASEGLKTKLGNFNYDDPDYTMLAKMRGNLYTFSGAKTYAQLREVNDLLYDEKGRIVPFDIFKTNVTAYYQKIGSIDEKYIRWLRIEYDTAIAQGTKARQYCEWMEHIDLFPNVKYVTAGDDRVRPAHAALDGVVVAKRSPYLDKIIPVKDWGCRCDMVETDEPVTDNPPDVQFDGPFSGNVGKDGIVIAKNHPYFPEAKKDLQAIQQRVDEFALKEHIKNNQAVYDQRGGDKEYDRIRFDKSTGGFLIRHTEADTYNTIQKTVIDKLVNRGERVILPKLQNASYKQSGVLTINESKFEIKDLSGNVKKQTEKKVKEAMGDAANVLLYFDNPVDLPELKRGLGNLSKTALLNAVMIMVNDNIIVITKKDILTGDFSLLSDL